MPSRAVGPSCTRKSPPCCDLAPRLSCSEDLQTVDGECPLDPGKIEIVAAKNRQVAQLVAQAEFVIGLKLVAVAGPADALKIFAQVGVSCFEPPDEPRGYNVVHMATDVSLLEVYSTGSNLAVPAQGWNSLSPPISTRWAHSRPLPLDSIPTNWSLLRTETGPAVSTSPVAIRIVAAVNNLEYFCSPVTAMWTSHLLYPTFFGS